MSGKKVLMLVATIVLFVAELHASDDYYDQCDWITVDENGVRWKVQDARAWYGRDAMYGRVDNCWSWSSVIQPVIPSNTVGDVTVPIETKLSYAYGNGRPTDYGNDGPTVKIVGVDSLAFCRCSQITSITIPAQACRVIGDTLFPGCSSLKHVTFGCLPNTGERFFFKGIFAPSDIFGIQPSNVTVVLQDGKTIWRNCFKECNVITAVELPPNLETIGSNAFESCKELSALSIPESVTNIGEYAFSKSGLTYLRIPQGIRDLPRYTFLSCKSLTAVDLPQAMTNIGQQAFANCSELREIDIPSGMKNIGASAFYACDNLSKCVIPSGVTDIGKSAFYSCKRLRHVRLPLGIREVRSSTFESCSGIESLEIPLGVTNIESSAFFRCSNIPMVELPSSVTSIGNYAFYGCSGMKKVNLSANLADIGNSVFYGCSGLKKVDIPFGVQSIGGSAFRECSGLQKVDIPASVKSIGSNAFYGCTGLTAVYFRGNAPQVSGWPFPTSTIIYVRPGTTGWKDEGSIELPETWCGCKIVCLSGQYTLSVDDQEIATGDGLIGEVLSTAIQESAKSGKTVVVDGNVLDDLTLVPGSTLVVKGKVAGKVTVSVPNENMSGSYDITDFVTGVETETSEVVTLKPELDEAAVEAEKSIADVLNEKNLSLFQLGNGGTDVEVELSNVKPGLFYGLGATTNLIDLVEAIDEARMSQAQQGTVKLKVKIPKGNSAFFRLRVRDRR